MIEYVKLLIDRIDRHNDAAEKSLFIKNLIRSEALENLDVLQIVQLEKVKKNPEEARKAIMCFRVNSSELMTSLGVRPEDILRGDLPALDQGLLDVPRGVGGNRLDSLEDFDKQSDLWLFTFSDRKIRLLSALAARGFDLHGLLGLTKRLKNISYALRILRRRLS